MHEKGKCDNHSKQGLSMSNKNLGTGVGMVTKRSRISKPGRTKINQRYRETSKLKGTSNRDIARMLQRVYHR